MPVHTGPLFFSLQEAMGWNDHEDMEPPILDICFSTTARHRSILKRSRNTSKIQSISPSTDTGCTVNMLPHHCY